MFYLSKLLGSPVKDVENKSAGTLHDLVVNTRQAYPRVTAVGVQAGAARSSTRRGTPSAASRSRA